MNFVLRKKMGVGSFLPFRYLLFGLLVLFFIFSQAKMAEASIVEYCKDGDRWRYNSTKEAGQQNDVLEECPCGCFETDTGSATHCKACSGGGGGDVCDGTCSPRCGTNPKECPAASIQGV